MKKRSVAAIASSQSLLNRGEVKSIMMVFALLVLLCPLLLPLSVHAEDKYWIGETDWWDEDANWNPLGQPEAGDNVFLTQSDGVNRNVYYRNSASPDSVIERLDVSALGTGNITLNLGQDRLEVNSENIGADMRNPIQDSFDPNLSGTVIQTDGNHVVNGKLILGQFGSGTYNMIGGTLSAGTIYVGDYHGKGYFSQSGGTVEADRLYLNERSEGYAGGNQNTEAIYDLTGGSLTTNYTTVGGWYDGHFNQSGGTHVTGQLLVGSDGDGWYNLSGGTLIADRVELGSASGPGTFTQTGGSHTVHDTLTIHYNSYNLAGGTLTASDIINEGHFNYSGGTLNSDIENKGTVSLSGNGNRWINGDVINNGTWESTDTTASYQDSFINNDNFSSENSIQYFKELSIGDAGRMTGSGDAPWFVKETFSGLSILDSTVTNIFGEDGFDVYYNPFALGNEYLGGWDYDLTGGGSLTALDGIVTTDQYFMTDLLTLGDTFAFDAWWEMGLQPDGFNFDLMFFHDNEWEIAGWDLNLDGSSSDWETLSYWVPEWARGLETQIKFVVADLGQYSDPTVYLKNIRSSGLAPVPEPSAIFLLSLGLIMLIGNSRKMFKGLRAEEV